LVCTIIPGYGLDFSIKIDMLKIVPYQTIMEVIMPKRLEKNYAQLKREAEDYMAHCNAMRPVKVALNRLRAFGVTVYLITDGSVAALN